MQFHSFLCRRQFLGSGAARFGRVLAALAMMAALGGASASGQQGRQSPNPDRPYLLPQANRLPDANDQMLMREQQSGEQDFENANTERHKLLTAESSELLALAANLKTEMDKTSKDALSLQVIRDADQIEKLARDVKAKMKLAIGPS
jgi:hypothetical protein